MFTSSFVWTYVHVWSVKALLIPFPPIVCEQGDEIRWGLSKIVIGNLDCTVEQVMYDFLKESQGKAHSGNIMEIRQADTSGAEFVLILQM